MKHLKMAFLVTIGVYQLQKESIESNRKLCKFGIQDPALGTKCSNCFFPLRKICRLQKVVNLIEVQGSKATPFN